jgi:hypothetical protein
MGKLLDKISEDMKTKSLDVRAAETRKWLLKTVNRLKRIDRKRDIAEDEMRHVSKAIIGKMYFFFYDPETKDELPYYDKFPLVIPIKKYDNGFLGLNLHYIPPRHRIIFLDKLYDVLSNKEFDETTKIRINYDMLNGIDRYKEFRPCVKRYLMSNVKTPIVEIESSNWETAAVLPVEFFVKKELRKVFKESMDAIKNGI